MEQCVSWEQMFLDALREWWNESSTMWWRMTWVYRSNWRVMHVDGFERSPYSLPERRGREIKFFNYAES